MYDNNARLVIGRTSTNDDYIIFVEVVTLSGVANLPGGTVREPEWNLGALTVPVAEDEHDDRREHRLEPAVLETGEGGGPEGHCARGS